MKILHVADTHLGYSVGLEPGDLLPILAHNARVGGQHAGDKIEQGGLPCTIRSDHGLNQSRLNGEGNIVYSFQTAEGTAQSSDLQQQFSHPLAPVILRNEAGLQLSGGGTADFSRTGLVEGLPERTA